MTKKLFTMMAVALSLFSLTGFVASGGFSAPHAISHPAPSSAALAVSVDPDSASAADVLGSLPIVLRAEDRMGLAAVIVLSEGLDTTGVTAAHEYRAGDVGYWPKSRTIFIFTTAGTAVPDEGFLLLGHLTTGVAPLLSRSGSYDISMTATGIEASRP